MVSKQKSPMIDELYERIAKTNPTLQGWCTAEKAMRLAKAIADCNSNLSVEIGIFGGRSLIPMAMAHNHIKHGVVWGFDPWHIIPALEGTNDPENDEWWKKLDLEAIYRGFVEKVLEYKLLKECFWSRLKSDQAIRLFANDSISVLHCDSNHSQEISCREIQTWAPKVKIGGYWFADDTDWPTMQKAKTVLVDHGFRMVEDFKKWAVYQKIINPS